MFKYDPLEPPRYRIINSSSYVVSLRQVEVEHQSQDIYMPSDDRAYSLFSTLHAPKYQHTLFTLARLLLVYSPSTHIFHLINQLFSSFHRVLLELLDEAGTSNPPPVIGKVFSLSRPAVHNFSINPTSHLRVRIVQAGPTTLIRIKKVEAAVGTRNVKKSIFSMGKALRVKTVEEGQVVKIKLMKISSEKSRVSKFFSFPDVDNVEWR